MRSIGAVLLGCLTVTLGSHAAAVEPAADEHRWPILFQDDFELGLARWSSPDPVAFRLTEIDGNHVIDQFQQSQVRTPVRSPFNRALVSDVVVGSFQLDLKFRSTARDYPHRSLCLFFGFQDPAHMYYVHFGQKTDDHANQIFIVNDAPRTKISTKTTPSTPWTTSGTTPASSAMSRPARSKSTSTTWRHRSCAVDKTFEWGRVGVGSFDDTGLFDDVVLRGAAVE
ncbi:MAG: hypothetical protein R3B90_02975 [Planctomycetaceae bacterium]